MPFTDASPAFAYSRGMMNDRAGGSIGMYAPGQAAGTKFDFNAEMKNVLHAWHVEHVSYASRDLASMTE